MLDAHSGASPSVLQCSWWSSIVSPKVLIVEQHCRSYCACCLLRSSIVNYTVLGVSFKAALSVSLCSLLLQELSQWRQQKLQESLRNSVLDEEAAAKFSTAAALAAKEKRKEMAKANYDKGLLTAVDVEKFVEVRWEANFASLQQKSGDEFVVCLPVPQGLEMLTYGLSSHAKL